MIIKIGKDEYPLDKPKLKQWIYLEEIRNKIIKAAEISDGREFLDNYYLLISAALGIPIQDLVNETWHDLAVAYLAICQLQIPKLDFPMLYSKSKSNDTDWEYEGRNWYSWLHIIAKRYGWTIEYIENMDFEDAVGLLHEILSEEYYAKEWEWGLSEMAYSYNSSTKTSKYNPLPKPEWMKVRTKQTEIPKVKIKKSMLPAGVVVQWKENDAEH